MARILILLASCIALLPGLLSAGTASGTLTVQGKTFSMKHSYAVQFPDWFDKSKMGTRLLVSDAPVPEKSLQEETEIMSLAREGKINAVQFEIGAERTSISMSIWSNSLPGSVSSSTNFDPAQMKVFTATRIEGALSSPAKKLGDMTYEYKVQFATAIQPRVVAPPPTAADTAAAAKATSTVAYLAWAAALKAGNKAKLIELASPAVRKMIDQPDFAEKLAFIQEMAPTDLKVLKAEENGDDARLTVSGKRDGETISGVITMLRQSGKWLLVKESWKSGQ